VGYDAFVSYRHGADAALAEAIERGLQRLARPWNRLRAMSVFRDQSDLAAESDLSGAITRALDDTRFLVLLASPESARSPWVDKEVAYWCDRRHGPEQLIVVVTDGEFVWDEVAGRLTESSDAVSAAVRSRFITEPLYVDLRWARAASELSLRESRFRSAIVLIAATIRGVAPADLESEDVRLHRRARRLARSAVATVLMLALVASVAAVVAVSNARRADMRARDALGRQLGLVALDLPASEVDQAFLLSLIAANLDSGGDTERFQASRALIGRYSRLEQLLYAPGGTASIRDVAISPTDDRTILATFTADGTTRLLAWVLAWEEVARSEPSRTDMAVGILPAVSFTGDGTALVGGPPETVVVLGDSSSLHRTIPHVAAIDTVRGLAATSAQAESVQLIRIDDGTVLAQSLSASDTVDLRFGRVATTSGDRVVVLDAGNGSARSAPGTAAGANVVGAGPNDGTAAVTVSIHQLVGWRREGDRLKPGHRAPLPDGVGNPRQVVVAPDGTRVLVVGDTGLAVVRLADGVAENVDPAATGIVSVDPSGRFAAVGGARLTIWDLANGRPAFSVPRPVNAMAWSGPCGRKVVCTLATVGESLDAWQPEFPRHVELVEQTNAQTVAISADATTVVTAGWGPTVAVWGLAPIFDDLARSEIDAAALGAGGDSQCPPTRADELRAVSPDSRFAVTHRRGDGTTTVCDTRNGSVVARARIRRGDPPDAVAVDDLGDVAMGGGGFVELYRREGMTFTTGRAIDVRLGSEQADVTSLAYHAGTIAAGIRPAARSVVARVFVWQVDDGGTPAQFETDHFQVPAIALLGDKAEVLAVAARDEADGPVTLEIWETASRRRFGRALRGLSGDLVALSGDESAVVAADSSGKAYRWELDRDPTRDICNIVGRPLTEREWNTLAGGVLGPYARFDVCTGDVSP